MNRTEQWVSRITDGSSRVMVAKVADIPQPTLTRQVQADNLTIENVVKIARAFGESIPDALVWHGVVSSEELGSVAIRGSLSDASDQQLLDEISRRLALVPEGASEVFDSVPGVANVGGSVHDEIPHVGKVDIEALRQSGVALAADERAGVEEEQEKSQELP